MAEVKTTKSGRIPVVLRISKTNGMPVLCFTGHIDGDVCTSFEKDEGPRVKCAWFAPGAGGGLAIWFWDESWRSVLRRTRAYRKGAAVRHLDDLLREVKVHRPGEYRVVNRPPNGCSLAVAISEMRT